MSEIDIEFESEEQCQQVYDLMNSGMKFNEAIDYLELRPFKHFVATRVQ